MVGLSLERLRPSGLGQPERSWRAGVVLAPRVLPRFVAPRGRIGYHGESAEPNYAAIAKTIRTALCRDVRKGTQWLSTASF